MRLARLDERTVMISRASARSIEQVGFVTIRGTGRVF
jgi:hypothetical protein